MGLSRRRGLRLLRRPDDGNIYDLETQKLVWTGLTQSWIDTSTEKEIPKAIYAVLWDLRSKKAI